MWQEDRKLALAGVVVLAVIAIELAWFLFGGPPPNHAPEYGTRCINYCGFPWGEAATIFFNAVLTFSTIGLWISTRDSARIATRALTEHERPWIFRDIVSVHWRNRPGITHNDWEISLRWKNVGRAPAILVDFVFRIQDVETLPAVPDYTVCDHLGVIDAMPAKDDVEYNTQGVGLAVPGTKANGDPIEYVFWGRLRYREMNGTEHISGYALRLVPFAAGAMSHNSDAYNYYT